MSGEKYVTISLMVPTEHKMMTNTLTTDTNNDTEVIRQLKNAMLSDLKSRYQNIKVQIECYCL